MSSSGPGVLASEGSTLSLRRTTSVHSGREPPPHADRSTALVERRVPITVYRLFVSSVIIALGVGKAVVTHRGMSAISTVLDLVLGICTTLMAYWLDPIEKLHPDIMPAIFQLDIRDLDFAKTSTYPTSLPFKITWHRVQSTIVLLSLCIAKAITGLRGGHVVGAAMDWLLGAFLAVTLYWVGFHEFVRPAISAPYYHYDLLRGDERVPRIKPEDFLDHKDNHEFIDRYKIRGVSVTGYRMLTTAVLLTIGTIKFVFALFGKPGVNTFEWVFGVALTLFIYWLGFFEPPRAKGWSLFYHQDYSYLIQDLVSLCMVLCVVGPQVMGPIGILILFAAHQIVPHSLDNGVDTACRVVSIIWFIYLGLMILKTLADRSEGYSELSVFEDVMGWVMLSWFPLVLIDGIKLGWGRGLDPDYWVDAWVLGWWKTMQQLIESGALSGV